MMFFYGYRKKYARIFGYIPAGWQVHHINGKRWDNRPANLVAIPERLHGEYHRTKPGALHWLQRTKDAKVFADTNLRISRHLECCAAIAQLYHSRRNQKQAVTLWSNVIERQLFRKGKK